MLESEKLRCWLVFWGMIEKDSALKDVHDRTYGKYRRYLEELLGRLATDHKMPLLDIRLAAIGLLALVDGLLDRVVLESEILQHRGVGQVL